jgi:hypothetical protein
MYRIIIEEQARQKAFLQKIELEKRIIQMIQKNNKKNEKNILKSK